jgi:uncharacterized protein (TIGR02594 family)
MAIDCSVPRHLMVMRTLTGTREEPGSGSNDTIMAMRDWIACTYANVDGMMEYCEQYTGDDIAWCGLCAAFCVTAAGVMPPFVKGSDTDCFLWAQSFASDPNFIELDEPVLGAIVVLTRSGGGHVTFYEDTDGSSYVCRGGNQSDAVTVDEYPISDVIGVYWPRGVPLPVPGPGPEPVPPDSRRTLEEGDSGDDVAEVQRRLGIPIDGEFGGQTTAAVMGFQNAMGLADDGCVGPMTWEELDDLETRRESGNDGLEPHLQQEIIAMAVRSPANAISWKDRGRSPPGYLAGMALCFALAVRWYEAGVDSVSVMAQADRDEPETDALSWYSDQFKALGMDNSRDGLDTLRHLFTLAVGLSMRESSGNHWCGRDQSASNTSPDSAEAGLHQTSWDIRGASPQIEILFEDYWNNPNGFRETFTEGLSPNRDDLENYGNGYDGTRHQWLSKFCPAYHVMMTAVGMRLRGGEEGHWGPIRTHAAEIKREVNTLLRDVQEVILPSSV